MGRTLSQGRTSLTKTGHPGSSLSLEFPLSRFQSIVMRLFGQKRRRVSRHSGLERHSVLSEWLPRVFRERSIFAPVCIGLLAIVALTCAVEGWRSTFPYRVGARFDHDLLARVSFKRANLSNTEKAKADAVAQVPLIFVNETARLKDLPERLSIGLRAIADAKSLNDVDAGTRAAFGLVSTEQHAASDENLKIDFKKLRALVSDEEGKPGKRIETLINDFKRFVQPLQRYGRADSSETAQLKLKSDDRISVIFPDGRSAGSQPFLAEVVLEDALQDKGKFGTQWDDYSELFPLRNFLKQWLLSQTPFTLKYQEEATRLARRQAREETKTVYDAFEERQTLLEAGTIIDDETLAVLRTEYRAFEAETDWLQRVGRVAMVATLLLLLAVLMGDYLIHNEWQLVSNPLRLSIYLASLVATVALGRLLASGTWRAEIIPLIAAVMIFTVAYDQRLGLLTAIILSLVISLSTTAELGHFLVLLSVSACTVIPLSRVPSRSKLIKVGFWAAAVYFVVSLGSETIWNHAVKVGWTDTDLLLSSLRGAGCCLVAGYLVAGSLPFIESAFGVVTGISLLEMSDVSHPLLQELARRAPGTYNHSISVATIGEAAADTIGANGLLVRVGAYFHDIGKMLKPEYFIENISEGRESKHKKLAPAMSTLIIIGHVKDGVDLAEQHNLPQSLIDFIEQHHGTTLVEYFYHEATKQAELQPDHKTDAEESSFRYPGPKPQTKEAGVMMLADAVESASRTLSEPTPKRIGSLVKTITMKKLLDDQFDECSLTLSEIRAVEESLAKSLIAIYHGRIKYPEQRSA